MYTGGFRDGLIYINRDSDIHQDGASIKITFNSLAIKFQLFRLGITESPGPPLRNYQISCPL
jgi:hypothetical protein